MNMIDSFIIRNFKNIENLVIPKLARVNLIVGKNSVGKSTLLEALTIFLSQGDEYTLKEILAGRGENIKQHRQDSDFATIAKDHYLSLFKDWEENYSNSFFILVGESENNAVKLNQVFIQEYRDDEDYVVRKVFNQEDLTGDELSQSALKHGLSVLYNNGKMRILSYDRAGLLPVTNGKQKYQIVHTLDFDSNMNAQLFDRVSLSSEEQYIIQALNIINPDIDRISFVSEGSSERVRIPVVSLKSNGRRVRLSTMGDGINRILTIILSLLNAKDGVLLLDEFETGLHYSVQKQLWEIVFMLAQELNTQVFVTSHSSDCLHSFAQVNVNGEGMLIRLENRQKGIFPVCYFDNNDIAFAADNDIELR